MSAPASPAYLELLNFLAGGITPQELIAFHPSPAVQQRVSSLVEREHDRQLSEDERQELDDFFQLEHLIIMAKARVRLHIPQT